MDYDKKSPTTYTESNKVLIDAMMKNLNVVTLPVVNDKNKLEGVIVTGDIAMSYMDVYDSRILSIAKTQYKNIMDAVDGEILTLYPISFTSNIQLSSVTSTTIPLTVKL